MDDVTFDLSGPYGDSGGVIVGRSLMSMNALLVVVVGMMMVITMMYISLILSIFTR